MIYKIVGDLKDNMGAHRIEPIYDDHVDLGSYRSEVGQPSCGDYLIIDNGKIYADSPSILGCFDGVIYDYPKNDKEIKDFLNKNKDVLIPLTEKAYDLDYDLSKKSIDLNYEIIMLEDYIDIMADGWPIALLPRDKRESIDEAKAALLAARNQLAVIYKKQQRLLYPVRQIEEKER